MAQLVWDNLGDRLYMTGLDRGVIYTRDGEAHVWNGLQRVVEKTNRTTTPVYFDGVKSYDQVTMSAYSGTITAITYPQILETLSGKGEYRPGFYLGDQPAELFSLCYRTFKLDALGREYPVLHILYNVTAQVSERSYDTLGANVVPTVFTWDITTLPMRVQNARASGYFELDSSVIDPLMFEEIEERLYGTDTSDPSLPSIAEIAEYYDLFYRVIITDNGDGTWTAVIPHVEDESLLVEDYDGPGTFELSGVTTVESDADSYTITSTKTNAPGG